jgi:hypothetical protein
MFPFRKKAKTIPRDEFIERICCTVPGMTLSSNIYLMDKAVSEMPDHSGVLEIGSFAGQSAIILHYLMQKYGKQGKIVCVDPFIYAGWEDERRKNDPVYMNAVGNSSMTRTSYMQFVEEAFRKNVSFFCPVNTPALYKMKSNSFFEDLENGKFPELKDFRPGLCYIDGDHGKKETLDDLRNCMKHSGKNAFILVDDSYRGISFGSGEAISEVRQWKELEVVGENPNFMFRKNS